MQRITTLLGKIEELAAKGENIHAIELDLMLDYTRVLYADLLEIKKNHIPFEPVTPTVTHQAEEPIVEETETEQNTEIIEEEDVEMEIPVSQLKTGFNINNIAEPTLDEVIPAIPTEEETEVEKPIVEVKLVAQPQADIRRQIGINDKYQYISELFGNNKEAYENVLNKINHSDSYESAVNWLDEIHTEQKWDDENLTVASFYELLNHFFASR